MTNVVQAKHAFVEDREHVGFAVIAEWRVKEGGQALALLAPLDGSEAVPWSVTDGKRLRTVLDRDDLTRVRDLPLVVANPAAKIFGIAAGPAVPPAQIAVLAVFDLEREVLAADGDDQPEWWLFDGAPVPPEPGSDQT